MEKAMDDGEKKLLYNVIKIEWQCREQEKDDVKNINMTYCRKINKIKKR